jgi:hypothetical protein
MRFPVGSAGGGAVTSALATASSLVRPRGEALAKTVPDLDHDQHGNAGTVSKRAAALSICSVA